MKKFALAILAIIGFAAVANAETVLQRHQKDGGSVWMAKHGWTGTLQPDGGTKWECYGTLQRDDSCKRSSSVASAPRQQASAPPPNTCPYAAATCKELAARYAADHRDLSKSAVTQLASAPAVSDKPSRVFTGGASIEDFAADIKVDGKKGVINTKAEDIIAEIKKLSSVDVTAESLFVGNLVECQDAGVKGKQRFGLKVEGVAKKFAPVDGTFEKCQKGQRLYVVTDAQGKTVAFAETTENGSFLLGPTTSASPIKIDR